MAAGMPWLLPNGQRSSRYSSGHLESSSSIWCHSFQQASHEPPASATNSLGKPFPLILSFLHLQSRDNKTVIMLISRTCLWYEWQPDSTCGVLWKLDINANRDEMAWECDTVATLWLWFLDLHITQDRGVHNSYPSKPWLQQHIFSFFNDYLHYLYGVIEAFKQLHSNPYGTSNVFRKVQNCFICNSLETFREEASSEICFLLPELD